MRRLRVAHPWSPEQAALRLARDPGLAWLDGGLEHGREGRFSFVGTAPCAVVESRDAGPPWGLLRALKTPDRPSARDDLDAELQAHQVPCWVGHVAYDAAAAPIASAITARTGAPALRFARHDAWYAYDHERGEGSIVGDDEQACERLAERLARPQLTPAELAFRAGELACTAASRHRAAILGALELIREGELYEINLARRWSAPFAGSALGLFLRMRALSPVPLGYFVDGGDHAVLGRSMERFLRYRRDDRSLVSAPIKGTLARAGADAEEARRLREDPKEHAEHAMVVDLMRNDLSRVCEVGSVEVSELMAVLPFAGLSHLVSTVRGRVRADVGLRELVELTFPPGSVTGTPKERVLRAIAELEQVPRGVYTGCMGYVDRAGGCSFAVAIRTAVVDADEVTYFAGGGIVADSDPEREIAETELKAAMFLRALDPTW